MSEAGSSTTRSTRSSIDNETSRAKVRWWSGGLGKGYIIAVGGMSGTIYHDYDIPPDVEAEMATDNDNNPELSSLRKVPSHSSFSSGDDRQLPVVESLSSSEEQTNSTSKEDVEREHSLEVADGLPRVNSGRTPSYISFSSMDVPPPPSSPELSEIVLKKSIEIVRKPAEARKSKWRTTLTFMRSVLG
jgi:hypothetical protein